jgi:uncharacterized protein YaaQ
MSPASTLLIAVVQPEDAPALLRALADAGGGATYLAARGGFLRRQAVAVLALIPTARIPVVLAAVRATCARRTALATPLAEAEPGYPLAPLEVEVGGAVIFGVPASLATRWGAPAGRIPSFASLTWPVAVVDAGTPPAQDVQEDLMLDTAPTTLIVAVVPDRAAERVVAALVAQRFGATTIASTGGFLRRGNTTILSGVPAARAAEAARVIEAACRAAGAPGGAEGGLAFALDVAWQLRV